MTSFAAPPEITGSLARDPRRKAIFLLGNIYADNSRPYGRSTKNANKKIISVDIRKTSGTNSISLILLKKYFAKLSTVSRIMPQIWREANAQTFSKKGDRLDPNNYNPIAVSFVLCKVKKSIIN